MIALLLLGIGVAAAAVWRLVEDSVRDAVDVPFRTWTAPSGDLG